MTRGIVLHKDEKGKTTLESIMVSEGGDVQENNSMVMHSSEEAKRSWEKDLTDEAVELMVEGIVIVCRTTTIYKEHELLEFILSEIKEKMFSSKSEVEKVDDHG